jgi:hypothetical protein
MYGRDSVVFETMLAKAAPNASFRWHATAFQKYPIHPVPALVNPRDRRAPALAERL